MKLPSFRALVDGKGLLYPDDMISINSRIDFLLDLINFEKQGRYIEIQLGTGLVDIDGVELYENDRVRVMYEDIRGEKIIPIQETGRVTKEDGAFIVRTEEGLEGYLNEFLYEMDDDEYPCCYSVIKLDDGLV